MKTILLFLIPLFIITSGAFSQDITVKIGQTSACKGDTILVPFTVKGFSNICAIGVRIAYDTLKLKYINCVNIHPTLPSADFARVRNFVTIGWFSIKDGIVSNIKDNGTLFEIKFYCIEPSSEFNFEESGCVASDCNLKELKLKLIAAKILPGKRCR